MAVGVKCPYCGKIGYTSSPQANSRCPYCGRQHDLPHKKESKIRGKSIILTPGKRKERKGNAGTITTSG